MQRRKSDAVARLLSLVKMKSGNEEGELASFARQKLCVQNQRLSDTHIYREHVNLFRRSMSRYYY